MDLSKQYGFATGFSFRREPFGGILFQFEGDRPDPRLTFVESPFLIGLLELLEQAPVAELIEAVRLRFDLSGEQLGVIHHFLAGLAQRGALVEK